MAVCYTGRRWAQSAGFQAYYTIALRDDDAPTLDKLRAYFNCGRMEKKNPSRKQNAEGHARPQKKFVINRLEDLVHVVIPHFEAYPLQSKKAKDYAVWKALVLFVYERLYGKKGWVRRFPQEVGHLQAMCAELVAVREYPQGVTLQ